MALAFNLAMELTSDIWPLVTGFLTATEAYKLATTTRSMWRLLAHYCLFSWRVKCYRLYTKEACLSYLRSSYLALSATDEWRVWERLASAWDDSEALQYLLAKPPRVLALPRETQMISYGRDSLVCYTPSCDFWFNASTGELDEKRRRRPGCILAVDDDIALCLVVSGNGKLTLMSLDGEPMADVELPALTRPLFDDGSRLELRVDVAASIVYVLHGVSVVGYRIDSARAAHYLYTYDLPLSDRYGLFAVTGPGHCVVFHDNQYHIMVYHALTGQVLLDLTLPRGRVEWVDCKYPKLAIFNGEGLYLLDLAPRGTVNRLSTIWGRGEEWDIYRWYYDAVRIDPRNPGQYLLLTAPRRPRDRSRLVISRQTQDEEDCLKTIHCYEIEEGHTTEKVDYQHNGRVVEVLVNRRGTDGDTGIHRVFDRVVWLNGSDLSPIHIFRNCAGFWRSPIRDAVVVVERSDDNEGVVVRYWDLTRS